MALHKVKILSQRILNVSIYWYKTKYQFLQGIIYGLFLNTAPIFKNNLQFLRPQ